MSHTPTALHINALLESGIEFLNVLYSFGVPDPDSVRIDVLRSTPDSDLWLVGPVSVTKRNLSDQEHPLLYPEVMLVITVIDGPEYRVWAMDTSGMFVAYMEA